MTSTNGETDAGHVHATIESSLHTAVAPTHIRTAVG